MSQRFGSNWRDEYGPFLGSPSEPESYTEHQAALEATLFQPDCDANELVLELDAGELRLLHTL